MRQRILIALATMIGALALMTPSANASPSQAAAEATTTGSQIVQVESTDADAQQTCNYRVNRVGGIYIYASPSSSARIVGSLANGHRFSATCNNGRYETYPECGGDNLWKFVGNGYVKTKCLVRV